MRRIIVAAGMFSSLALLSTPAFPQSGAVTSQVEIVYVAPGMGPSGQISRFNPIYKWLTTRQPLEELKAFLSPLRLPRKLTVQVDECGADRRPYLPGGPVTICYEFIKKLEDTADQNSKDDAELRATVVTAMFVDVTLHELAYAIFDILHVPVWGRMEDAADRLSAFILLQFGEDVTRTTINGLATFLGWPRKTWSGELFASEESPAPQRFYDYLCIAYGGDPVTFYGAVAPDRDGGPLLPWSRAGVSIIRDADALDPKTHEPIRRLVESHSCQREYEQVRNAFNLRIMPYVDPDLLLKVKAAQWFRAGELGKPGK
jgi:hypothetical protein